ncbi:MAG TPA: hypothetical protein EYM25_06390, partial [Deltaproteobacteria bacterium]|nr:hypothetical protein [Deltaproteobacteria bacterium]
MPDSNSSSTAFVLETVANLGLPHEVIEIAPAYADTTAFCEKYGFPMEQSGNTIVVASKKEPKVYVACVVLATTRLDVNKRVRKLMGVSKASFASAEEMNALTGMEICGVTPFSLPE